MNVVDEAASADSRITTSIPRPVHFPALCQITLDLAREPGALISVPRMLFAHADDCEKLLEFGGELGPSDNVTLCQVYMPLASTAAVAHFENVSDSALLQSTVL
jgi:hypothetical protein